MLSQSMLTSRQSLGGITLPLGSSFEGRNDWSPRSSHTHHGVEETMPEWDGLIH